MRDTHSLIGVTPLMNIIILGFSRCLDFFSHPGFKTWLLRRDHRLTSASSFVRGLASSYPQWLNGEKDTASAARDCHAVFFLPHSLVPLSCHLLSVCFILLPGIEAWQFRGFLNFGNSGICFDINMISPRLP